MRQIFRTTKFKRAFKQYIQRHPKSLETIEQIFLQLSENPFQANLGTHKLKGEFAGNWACSAGYDLRIIFEFVENKPEDDILLLNIGTHDEVY